MERLLQESELTETWKSDDKGYNTSIEILNCPKLYFATKYFYSNKDGFVLAALNYTGDDKLVQLDLFGADPCAGQRRSEVEEFIIDYKIAPYTYNYYVLGIAPNPSSCIKPFTYIFDSPLTPLDQLHSPICVVYTGDFGYLVRCVLNTRGEIAEYEAGKMLQKSLSAPPKSARKN